MKKRPRAPKPTTGELQILRVLWDKGHATVREVYTALASEQTVRYTTVLKLMQIMAEKGLVARDESARAHVYRPLVKRDDAERRIVGDLIDRVFRGSASQLVLRVLSERPASQKEIADIRQILDAIERGNKR